MFRLFLAFVFVLPISISLGFAQDSIPNNYYQSFNTSWTAEIPVWIPGLRGTLSYGQIDIGSPEDGEETDFERVDSNSGLEFYFNGRIAKRFHRFWLSLDAFSGRIGSRFSYVPTSGDREVDFVDITISGTSPRLTIGYSIVSSNREKEVFLEVIPYTGLRYVNFRLKSDVFNTSDVINLNPNWIEPLVGLYVPISYKRFQLELQADYGWRDSNNSTAAFHGRFRYRFSKLIDMALGVSTMNFQYLDTINEERLAFDIRLVGPTLAASFNF